MAIEPRPFTNAHVQGVKWLLEDTVASSAECSELASAILPSVFVNLNVFQC